jgi:protein SCO1
VNLHTAIRASAFDLRKLFSIAVVALSCSLIFLACPTSQAQLNVDPAQSAGVSPSIFKQVRFDQLLGNQVPLNLNFLDEHGQPVTLRQFFQHGPVILTLSYYRCPMLCPQLLNSLVRGLRQLSFEPGKDYEVLTVSIDPTDSSALAATKHETYSVLYGHPGALNGWHFLTGKQAEIQELANAVGFHYAYDPTSRQFAHASGIVILTQDGVVSQYTYGVSFSERDLRLGLVRASQNKIGSVVDQVLLYCYHYDPQTGKYGLLISHVLQISGAFTVFAVGFMVLIFFRRENYKLPANPADNPRSITPSGARSSTRPAGAAR